MDALSRLGTFEPSPQTGGVSGIVVVTRWHRVLIMVRARVHGTTSLLERPASISMNAIATPAARELGPLVTRWRSRTVAKVDSGWWSADPVFGRIVVEGEQHVEVVGNLRRRAAGPDADRSRRRDRPGRPE